jgi:hypothetical protein
VRYLSGTVVHSGRDGGPAQRAARALRELGARTRRVAGRGERLRWGIRETRIGGMGGSAVAAEYLGLAAAGGLLAGVPLVPAARVSELRDGRPARRAVRLRCADGWFVARWRSADEPELLRALVGPLERASVASVWRAAAEARLLVTPVRVAPRVCRPRMRVLQRHGGMSRTSGPARIVDWTNLWAGPWATGALARDGADVVRIEAPSRRDGYHGGERWDRWNGAKRLLVADARDTRSREAIGAEISRADVLVSGHTPRVLPQLGFDDAWFRREAPGVFRLSLVAFEEPFTDAPGLGEHAAALSGLLTRREGASPAPPYPWADPLLGAWALLVLRAHAWAGHPAGGHIRLSLESAAARAAIAPGRAPGGGTEA